MRWIIGTALIGASATALVSLFISRTRRRKLREICFIPWQEANLMKRSDIVAVDCSHDIFTCLTHHRTSDDDSFDDIRGDTSTDMVINAIQSGHPFLNNISHVTVNHFDVDAFMSVWALMNPEKSLELRNAIRECAHIGDFRELGN
jgi:hypothetical protein